MGIFSDYAPKFYEVGFSIIPVRGKAPFFANWDQFKRRLPSYEELENWCENFPDYNIGLPMGDVNGFAALDIDFGELFKASEKNHPIIKEWADRILKLIPNTPLVRRGQKPFAALFRYSGQRNGPFEVNGIKVGEMIAGGQIVIPPSIHPDTNEKYEWDSAGLLTFPRDELFEMLPDFTDLDLVKLIAELETFIHLDHVPVPPHGRRVGAAVTEGRNNQLKSIGLALIGKGKSTEEIAAELLKEDQRLHGSNALFNDKQDTFRNAPSPEAAALKMTENLQKFVAKSQVQRGEIEVGETAKASVPAVKYPSKDDGFHVFDAVDEKWIPQYDECAAYLKFELGLKVRNGYAWIYKQTHYVQLDDNKLKALIDRITLRGCKPGTILQFFNAAIYKCTVEDSEFETPSGYLNCRNGTLRVSDRTLFPHSMSQHFTYCLPHDFDPHASCANWIKFLNDTFLERGELIDLAGEIFGYVLEGGKPWLHKAFILYGSGRNGKSTFLDVLRALIGPSNVSSVGIQNLNKEFSAVMLDGKLANIVGELSTKDACSETFKSVVAGETIPVARKGKDQYDLAPQCRFLVAANHFPRFHDSSVGAIERLCIVPFERFIDEKDRDPFMTEKLCVELSGIINWALVGLERLKERRRLPKVGAVQETLMNYRVESDSVYAYFVQNCVIGKYEDGSRIDESEIRIGLLWDYYDTWCHEEQRRSRGKISFGRELSALLKPLQGSDPNDPTFVLNKKDNAVVIKGRIRFLNTPKVFVKLEKNPVYHGNFRK